MAVFRSNVGLSISYEDIAARNKLGEFSFNRRDER